MQTVALRPKPPALSGDVPTALRDKQSPIWKSKDATRRWLTGRGLAWHPRMDAGPLNRHERAVIAWARAEGWTRQMPGGYGQPDWERLRAAGVPGWGGAELEEWVRHEGIEVA